MPPGIRRVLGAVEDEIGDDSPGGGGGLEVVECGIWTTGSSLAAYTAFMFRRVDVMFGLR